MDANLDATGLLERPAEGERLHHPRIIVIVTVTRTRDPSLVTRPALRQRIELARLGEPPAAAANVAPPPEQRASLAGTRVGARSGGGAVELVEPAPARAVGEGERAAEELEVGAQIGADHLGEEGVGLGGAVEEAEEERRGGGGGGRPLAGGRRGSVGRGRPVALEVDAVLLVGLVLRKKETKKYDEPL